MQDLNQIKKDFNWKDIFFFDKMITPVIIVVIYWLSLLGIVISGLREIFSEYGNVVAGLLILIIGPLIIRIYCELLIVIFKINSNLKKLVALNESSISAKNTPSEKEQE
jgi:hypothetical protein